jgi:SP family arabinose:H+ symporter-like MFS transporter
MSRSVALPSSEGALAGPHDHRYAYLVSLVAAISGLLFGFDIAVIKGAILYLRQDFGLNEVQTEAAASSLLIGCVVGASIAGWSGDRLGRRRALFWCAGLFAVSAIGAALPDSLAQFAAARFVGGIAIGAASLLAPVYIAEVAPSEIRGRLVALNQMAIVTGILLAYLTTWLLAFAGQSSWRWMFAAAAVPSLAFFLALFLVPESPRWLVERGRPGEAALILDRVAGPLQGRRELEGIRAALAEESGSLRELLQPGYRKALLIAVALAVLQQVTGINTVLFYGSVIFKEHVGGQSDAAALGANVLIGLVNLAATVVALKFVDRFGRRPLLMLSAGAMAGCQFTLGAAFLFHPPPAWLVLASMLLCVAAFAVGLGPCVWVLLAEIFPNRVRARAMSVATVALWAACFGLTMSFLTLAKAITPAGAFWLYAGLCVVTFWIVWRWTPETKRRSLEDIEKLWKPTVYTRPHT